MSRAIDVIDRQNQVFEYVAGYIARRGFAPTYREIQVACDFSSTASVRQYLERLEAAGKISFTPGVSRGIVIREAAGETS